MARIRLSQLDIRSSNYGASHKVPSRAAIQNASPGPRFAFRISFLALFLISGCGAPGEPHPPAPPIPVAVADLAAHQSGDGVTLTFTAPKDTVTGQRLAAPPTLEIFRGAALPDGLPDAKSFRAVYSIPGGLVEAYLVQEHVQFFDPFPPAQIRAHPGGLFFYRVRTRASAKKSSADSNTVSVRVYPVPESIGRVDLRVTEPAIELSWPVPEQTSAGGASIQISAYHIYRGEIDPSSPPAGPRDLSGVKWNSPLALLAPATTNRFRDTQFTFGVTYLYTVRSVTLVDGNALESADSVAAIVTPKDIFPPAPPQAVVAVLVSVGTPPALQADLSWSPNVETDLAGYRVYRSEKEGTKGQLLTLELLPAPAYRDMSVMPGHRYWYSVTAVDRDANESEPSAPAALDVAQPSAEVRVLYREESRAYPACLCARIYRGIVSSAASTALPGAWEFTPASASRSF
jgi:hypothetical protein